MNNPAAPSDARRVADLLGRGAGISCATPRRSSGKRGGGKIKGPRRQHLLFSVSLSLSAPSSQLAAPLAREMSDLKVCVLCASTQIRRVPDLGRRNNYLEMSASECAAATGESRSACWDQCNRLRELEILDVRTGDKTQGVSFMTLLSWKCGGAKNHEPLSSLTLVHFFFFLPKSRPRPLTLHRVSSCRAFNLIS